MASPIILILGGGVNTGVKVAQKFAANGFKIALVTRPSSTHQDDNTRDLILKHDFTDPTNIKSIFDEVKTKLGVPNVVVYNGRCSSPIPPSSFPPFPKKTQQKQQQQYLSMKKPHTKTHIFKFQT